MTLENLIREIEERKEQARRDLNESKKAGVNTPGFNQDLGRHDAYRELLEWIEEEE